MKKKKTTLSHKYNIHEDYIIRRVCANCMYFGFLTDNSMVSPRKRVLTRPWKDTGHCLKKDAYLIPLYGYCENHEWHIHRVEFPEIVKYDIKFEE